MSKTSVIWIWLPLLAALGWSGCKTSRGLITEKPVKHRKAEFLYGQMENNRLNPEWLSAKAKVSFDDGYQSMSGVASIRMQRDSVLWIAVRKLGFEVARVMITRDSVFMLDRLNNEYAAEELAWLANEYHFPADLNVLQALLLGNVWLPVQDDLQAVPMPPNYQLSSSGGYLKTRLLLHGQDYLLQEVEYDDQKEKQNLRMELTDYGQLSEDQKFSYFRNIVLRSLELGKLQVALRFSQVDTAGPLTFRFDIPDRYTRAN